MAIVSLKVLINWNPFSGQLIALKAIAITNNKMERKIGRERQTNLIKAPAYPAGLNTFYNYALY